MPRVAKEFSALEVKRLKHPGGARNATFAVGGVPGLLLQITPNGGRTWLLRASVGGKRREIGLGGFPEVPLSSARDRARDAKEQIRRGVDPVEERRSARRTLEAARRRDLSFSDAVEKCVEAKGGAFKSEKHRRQWKSSLELYAMPELGKMLVNDIETQDVLRVLQPIWETKTVTASRLRERIENVLNWSTVAGHRVGENPARWRGNLKELLPPASKVAKSEHHPAVQIDDAPRWFEGIGKRDGVAPKALQFAALTAVRSQEVRKAVWDEIDWSGGLWIVPGKRMKKDREFRVPLSDKALEILRALPRYPGNPLIFPAPRGGVLSDMSLSAAMRRLHAAELDADRAGFVDRVSKRPAVPHGLRSTFRDWVADRTLFPGDMAEVALSHKVASAVEAAYRRGDMIEKRRTMMTAWADYLTGKARTGADIVRFG